MFDTAMDFFRPRLTAVDGGSTLELGDHFVVWGDPELHSGLVTTVVASEEPVNIGDVVRLLHTPPTL